MLASLVGFGGGVTGAAESAKGDVSLTMWTFPFWPDDQKAEELANYQTMVQEFEAETGIHVDVEMLPWDNRETKILTAVAAGEGPDVVYLNPDILKQFQAYGILQPLGEYFSDEEMGGVFGDPVGQ